MSRITRSRCPLCRSDAKHRRLIGQARAEYTCPTCGRFQITEAAHRLLIRTDADRGMLSRMAAQAGKDHTLVVMVEHGRVVGKAVKTDELRT